MILNKQEAINTIKILQSLIDIGDASIILNTFISAFNDKQIIDSNGQVFLQGNFNLGGTKSTRLSSSNPNLQNIPSTGSKYAKTIKACFQYCINNEWIICGADFDSLEDKISALTTRDKNKLKVYLDKLDGHCLRAYKYFKDKMPDTIQLLSSDRCFKIIDTKGLTHYIKWGTVVLCPDGQERTIDHYYDSK